MSRNCRVHPFAVAALFALLLAAPAFAYSPPPNPWPIMPLVVGNRWDYRGDAGGIYHTVITGTHTLLGRTVFVMTFYGGVNDGLVNWWLTGPAGDVQLAGFDRSFDGLAVAYDPPITLCNASPTLGDSWAVHSVAHDLLGGPDLGVEDFTYGVLEDGELTLPAGTFRSFGVGVVSFGSPFEPLAASRGFTIDGRRAASGLKAQTTNATQWLSPGVGEVQYSADQLYQLTGFGAPTATHVTTWGMLKQLYR